MEALRRQGKHHEVSAKNSEGKELRGRSRNSSAIAATPVKKEELWQQLGNSAEDWEALWKSGKPQQRLGSSTEFQKAPAMIGKLQGQRTPKEDIAKASQRGSKGIARKG